MQFDPTQLLQGNNWIIVVLAVLLFKDQIIGWLAKKPVTPVPPAPPVVGPNNPPAPPPPVITIPTDHPLVDVLIKDVLPVLLPLFVSVLKKQEQPK